MDNTTLVPHCATHFKCGLTVFDAPRGTILGVSAVDVIKRTSDSSTTPTGTIGDTRVSGLKPGTVIGSYQFSLAIFDPPSSQIAVASIEKQGTYDVEIVGTNANAKFYQPTDPQYYQVAIFYTDSSGVAQTQSKNILLRSASQSEKVTVTVAGASGIEAIVTPVNTPFTDGGSTITVTVKVAQTGATSSPSGNVSNSLATNQNFDWCSEIKYVQVDACHIRNYLSRSARSGCCPNLAPFFALYGCGKTRFPEPTDAGLTSLPLLPLGFHYAQASTDARCRASRGIWAIERGKIYVAPWIQSTETLVVKWDGIKTTWADGDPFPEDPMFQKAVEAFVLWEHETKWGKDYDAAAAAKLEYDMTYAMLIRRCEDENRVRNCETSKARGSQFASATLFYNEIQSATAKCDSGATGADVTITIPAGTVASSVSVADANQLALQEAQSQAEAQLDCKTIYYNTPQSYTAQCLAGIGAPQPTGNPVTVNIPAGTFSSTISQADADAQALTQATSDANSQLACIWYNAPQTFTAECVSPATGDDVTVTIASGQYSSTISQDDANNQAELAAQTQAQSELSCSGGTLYWNTQQVPCYTLNCPIRQGNLIVNNQVTSCCTVAEHTFNSTASQSDANQVAFNYGRSLAQNQAARICRAFQAGTQPPSVNINYP